MTKTARLGSRVVLLFLAADLASAGCGILNKSDEKAASGSPAQAGGSGGVNLAACQSCAQQQCPTEASNCNTTAGCTAVVNCTLGCISSSDANCVTNCYLNVSATAQVAAASYAACATTNCLSQCTAPVNTGAGGGGNQGGNGAGTGGAGIHSGQNWLSITDSWADPGMPPNGQLNVSGAMYAYGDGCAQYTYDIYTGCVSGTLCPPNTTGTNWGIGIGFDFNNTGSSGTPANTKMPWNATAVNAIGFGWQLSGTAPGLQVWITNMDPKWGGQCTAADCGIAGPPDGRSSPMKSDTVNFAGMEKDYWGGTGVAYTFNPANILAIQFKLNSTNATSYNFDFCVDGISVILP
jgi:hypothetical protein